MKSVSIQVDDIVFEIPYEVVETSKGRVFNAIINAPALLKEIGSPLRIDLLENDNVVVVPGFKRDEAQSIKGKIITAIFKAEKIEF